MDDHFKNIDDAINCIGIDKIKKYLEIRHGISFGVSVNIIGNAQILPENISKDIHEDILLKVFSEGPLKYAELYQRIKFYFDRINISFGENKSRKFIAFYQEELYITKLVSRVYTLNAKLQEKLINTNA